MTDWEMNELCNEINYLFDQIIEELCGSDEPKPFADLLETTKEIRDKLLIKKNCFYAHPWGEEDADPQ